MVSVTLIGEEKSPRNSTFSSSQAAQDQSSLHGLLLGKGPEIRRLVLSERGILPAISRRLGTAECGSSNAFDEPNIEDEMTDQEQEIWAAIRYLDPDGEDKARDIAAFITVVALLLVVLVVFVLLWVRGVLV